MFLLAQLFPSQRRAFVPPWPKLNVRIRSIICRLCKMPSLQLLNCWTCLIIKCWKYNPHERRCSPCMCVCVCVCVCARARRALKRTSKGHFWVLVRPNDQIHIKHVKKTAGLKSIHLNTVYILKWTRTVGRKLCVSIFCLKVTDCFINVNQRENHPQLLFWIML